MSALIRTFALAAWPWRSGAAGPRRRRRLRCDERHRGQRAGLFRLRARHPRLAGVGRPGDPASQEGRAGDAEVQCAGPLPQPHQQGRSRPRTSKSPAEDRLQAGRRAAPPRRRQATCTSRPTARCSGCRIVDVSARVPGAAQHEVLRCRPGTPVTPQQRTERTGVPALLATLRRIRDTVLCVCRAVLASSVSSPRPTRRHRPAQRQDRVNTAPRRRRRSRCATARSPRSAPPPTSARWPGRTPASIDLDGRTVIPGLIDSHIHAIRAGLTFTTEVHWIGVRTLADALGRIRAAAEERAEGLLADRRRRLDRAAVRRRPPPDPGGDRRRRARPSRLCADSLFRDPALARRRRGAGHRPRTRR